MEREEEEKKRSIAEHRTWTLVKAQSDRVKENDTVNDLFAFLRSFTEALAEPLLRASAASHHIQHERVASTGPLVIALGVAYVPETERKKRTLLKSVLRDEKWNSIDSLMKLNKRINMNKLYWVKNWKVKN